MQLLICIFSTALSHSHQHRVFSLACCLRSCLQQPAETVRSQVLESLGCWLKLSCGSHLPPGLPESPLVQAALAGLKVDGTFHSAADAVSEQAVWLVGGIGWLASSVWCWHRVVALPGRAVPFLLGVSVKALYPSHSDAVASSLRFRTRWLSWCGSRWTLRRPSPTPQCLA